MSQHQLLQLLLICILTILVEVICARKKRFLFSITYEHQIKFVRITVTDYYRIYFVQCGIFMHRVQVCSISPSLAY